MEEYCTEFNCENCDFVVCPDHPNSVYDEDRDDPTPEEEYE